MFGYYFIGSFQWERRYDGRLSGSKARELPFEVHVGPHAITWEATNPYAESMGEHL